MVSGAYLRNRKPSVHAGCLMTLALLANKLANKLRLLGLRIGRDPPRGRAFPGLYYSSTPTSQFLKFSKKATCPI